MGGLGSSRWLGHRKRTTVEECRILPIWLLRPAILAESHYIDRVTWSSHGQVNSEILYLVEELEGDLAVRLTYTVSRGQGLGQVLSYQVRLQSTAQHLGGVRWWFSCPLSIGGVPCNRRAAKLYLPPGAYYFGCRHCYRLTYRSTQDEHSMDWLHLLLGRPPAE